MSAQDFINVVGPIVQAKALERGYLYPSAIIAQACLESNYGNSGLAKEPNYNLFGMKAGTTWTNAGKPVVTLSTKEQNKDGSYTTIKAAFRKYASYAECIDGYFDFINTTRYANLKLATSSKDYLEKIKADGYATSINYATNVYAVVTKYNLTLFDRPNYTAPTQTQETPKTAIEKIESYPEYVEAANTLANGVIKGLFSNGDERKELIYQLVQKQVNKILKG